VLPTAFRQCNVQRLAPFFIALRQTLAGLAPGSRENPRVVLLTPGPYNETFFEHAYLARYLGYALVQGNDLTVRDGRVYLKTLGGLQRVDVILRRVDDDYCDPLELFGGSFLGVPGLIEAVREGTVAVANALGSGALQAPALLSYLPGLCRFFLGEDLRMPSVRTWWCGDPDARRYVLEHLHELVVKPAFPTRGAYSEFGAGLSAAGREQLAARIAARPERYVAQEQLETHNAPVLLSDPARGATVQSRRFVVRAYLVATTAAGRKRRGRPRRVRRHARRADPGDRVGRRAGRVAPEGRREQGHVGAGRRPGQRGDAAPGRVPAGGAEPRRRRPAQPGGRRPVLARAVRPAGRRDGAAGPGGVRPADRPDRGREPRDRQGAGPGPARQAAGPRRRCRTAEVPRRRPGARADRELVADVFDPADRGGLRATVRSVYGLARLLRDRISADAWRVLEGVERDVADFNVSLDDDQLPTVLELLNRLTAGFLALAGVAADSMTRGQSWRFLDMGFRVERATAVIRLLRLTLVDASQEDPSLLEAVLEAGDSALTYRRRYLTQLEAPAVVDLLLADETNPRAVAFQVAALQEHLAALPHDTTHPRCNPDLQAAMQLRTLLRLADLPAACAAQADGLRPRLDRLLADAADGLAAVSDAVSQTYFSHAAARRRLLGAGPDRAG
jgi:uncharacterized alpha-E superfamily protein